MAEQLSERPAMQRGVWLLRLIMLFIIGGFFVTNVVALLEMRGVEAGNRDIVANALTCVEDLARMNDDLSRMRLLLDEHIFEKSGLDMTRLEGKIMAADADFDETALSYEPLATLPGEHDAFLRLRGLVAETRGPVAQVLALSRQNRDEEATRSLKALRDRYDQVSQIASQLLKINRAEADRAAETIHSLQRRSQLFLGAITLSGTLLSLLVAGWVTRLARRRTREMSHWADLLEERNRELDAFAGRVAHDLRGPLTTISLSAAQLARSQKDDGAGEVLRRGVARMETLIRDLLTLSRIDAQTPLATCEVGAVAASVGDDLKKSVSDAGGTLRVEVQHAMVRCSEGLLRQVLWNLGENAVKYRRPDVPLDLELRGREVGRSYEIRVCDNGSGMTREELRHAFEPFFRGEQARASTPGTGLGLSIVRRVIEAAGGEVTIESQSGKGTRFVIKLPLGGGRRG
jgi:signal transduction histidine kinase